MSQCHYIFKHRKHQPLIVRRLVEFIGHFEKEQVGNLLKVIALALAVVAEYAGEIPDFGDDGGVVHT